MTPEERFADAIAPFEGDLRVTAGTGFGGAPGRRINGRIFAMLVRGELVVKLPAGRVGELVEAGAATWFDAGKGRPMREWASVGNEGTDWPALVAEAFAFAGGDAIDR